MGLATTDEDGLVVPPFPTTEGMYGTQTIPWDDPYPYYRCMLPDDRVDNVEDAFELPAGRPGL